MNRDRAEQVQIAQELLEAGLTPVAVMTARMLSRPLSNGMLVTNDMFSAACALAPYVHPRLTAMALSQRDSSVAVVLEGASGSPLQNVRAVDAVEASRVYQRMIGEDE